MVSRTVTMDEEYLDIEHKPRSAAKKGRRAARSAKPDDDLNDVVDTPSRGLGADNVVPPDMPGDTSPRPSKAVSGWGEEAPRRRRNLGEGFEPFEDERLRPKTPVDDEDSDNDIPVIPDLEDTQEDEIGGKVAVAPNVAVNRVATYRELDNDLLRQAAFLTLDNDIDLKLLTKCLVGEADLLEPDVTWDWDRLFTEVTSELTADIESTEQSEKDPSPIPI